MKNILDFRIVHNQDLANGFVILTLLAPSPLGLILPGQFVEIKVENSVKTYLRRPFSINGVNYEKNEIYILIQRVGEGSNALANSKVGESVNVIFPLGNSFSSPTEKSDKILLIGGGCGSAPMLFLGKELKQGGYNPSFLMGARDEAFLLFKKEYEELGELYFTTETGSCGEKGYVTEHSCLNERWDRIYTCGPEPMMQAVARYAKQHNIHCEASLENTMACGIGACLCCVVDTNVGHRCVCTEGPVFNVNDLKWKN